jgi:L-malate glycosyltransferase
MKPAPLKSVSPRLPDPDRLAICTVGEIFGGVERHVLTIAHGFAARNIPVTIFLFHDGELAAQARTDGIEIALLSPRNMSLLITSWRFAHLLRERSIRLVHAHGYKATVLCALARLWFSFFLVKTEHGLPEPISSGPLRTLRNRCYYLIEHMAARLARMVVCYVTNDLQTHYAHQHRGLVTTVIANGVKTVNREHFSRPPDLPTCWFNLLTVGRLELIKGHHWAIRSIADASIAPHIHLHILGTGEEEQQLRRLSESLGLRDRVHFLGFRRNVYDYLAYCDALLIPSIHEGLPYTLLEAMALGIPTIASHVGGLAETLQDKSTALLVPPQDKQALTQAIQLLYTNESLRHHISVGARQLQVAKYSVETMTEQYLLVYRRLLITTPDTDRSI